MTEIDRSGTFENLDHSRRAPTGVRRFLLAVVDYNAEDNTNREEFVEFFIAEASAVSLSGWKFTDGIESSCYSLRPTRATR